MRAAHDGGISMRHTYIFLRAPKSDQACPHENEGPPSVRKERTATPFCKALLRKSNNIQRSSRPREFHPQPLTEPYVNLSIHTALIVQMHV